MDVDWEEKPLDRSLSYDVPLEGGADDTSEWLSSLLVEFWRDDVDCPDSGVDERDSDAPECESEGASLVGELSNDEFTPDEAASLEGDVSLQ